KINGVYAIDLRATFRGSRANVEPVGCGINDGSASNSYSCAQAGATAVISPADGRAIAEEAALPQRGGTGSIGVQCVNAVILGRDIKDVVCAPLNRDTRHIKRLRVYRRIQRPRAELAKTRSIHVGWSQGDLGCVRTTARVVVFRGEFAVGIRGRWWWRWISG